MFRPASGGRGSLLRRSNLKTQLWSMAQTYLRSVTLSRQKVLVFYSYKTFILDYWNRAGLCRA